MNLISMALFLKILICKNDELQTYRPLSYTRFTKSLLYITYFIITTLGLILV